LAVRLNADECVPIRSCPVDHLDRDAAERIGRCGGAGEKHGGESNDGKAFHWCVTYESISQRPLTSLRVAVTWIDGSTVGDSRAVPVLGLMS